MIMFFINTRRFPTVEFRFKRSQGENYHPLPSDADLVAEVAIQSSSSFDEVPVSIFSVILYVIMSVYALVCD